MTEPKRIQRRRTKGWRIPPNTVYVGRPSQWGNPIRQSQLPDAIAARRVTVELFRAMLQRQEEPWAIEIMSNIDTLRGKDLACWCSLDEPCHADVLLRLANDPASDPTEGKT